MPRSPSRRDHQEAIPSRNARKPSNQTRAPRIHGKGKDRGATQAAASGGPEREPGIFDLKIVDWDELDKFAANPLNWKKHPIRQKKAIHANIAANGWGRTLVFNVHTGRFIDGHGRREVALQQKLSRIPIALGWWTEEQERHLLQTADPLGAMYETDADALRSLNERVKADNAVMQGLERESQLALSQLHKDLESFAEEPPKVLIPRSEKRARLRSRPEPEDTSPPEKENRTRLPGEDETIEETSYRDDILFTSSNPWGLPDLDPSKLVAAGDAPTHVYDRSRNYDHNTPSLYCHSARPFPDSRVGGFLAFYTEDWRFEHIYEYPGDFLELLLKEDWSGLVMPDFSTYWEWPYAMRLWNLYRSRWCARYWQAADIQIIPTVGLTLPTEYDLFLGTLPRSPVIASRIHGPPKGDKGYWKQYSASIREAVQRLRPEVVLLYSGAEFERYLHGLLPKGPEYRFLPSFISLRRKKSR